MSVLLLVVGFSGVAIVVAVLGLALRGKLGPKGPATAVALLGMAGVSSETTVLGGSGRGLSGSATGLVLIGSVIAVAAYWSVVKSTKINPNAFWPFASAVWLFIVNAALVPETALIANLLRAAPALTWFALAILVGTKLLTKEGIAAAVCLAFGWACVLALMSDTPWGACSAFKCGPFGQLFLGPFANENYFGRLACLAAICSFVVWRQRFKWVAPCAACLVLFATASRTSQLALAVAIAVGFVAFQRLSTARFVGRSDVAWFASAAVCGLGVYLVYAADPSDFSNRGSIWRLGTEALGDAWPVGRGLSTWSTDVLERNFMHSEVLLMLYSGGAVAVVLWAGLLSFTFRSSTNRTTFSLWLVVAVLGLTEVIWNPLAVDGTVVSLLALLVIMAPWLEDLADLRLAAQRENAIRFARTEPPETKARSKT